MLKKLWFLAFLFFGIWGGDGSRNSAYGQSVQQSGSVTPGHTVKWVIDGVVQDGGLGFTELLNGTNTLLLDTAGHLRNTGSTPILSGCGTSPSIVGTDLAGEVTMGTGTPTGCIITFATAYNNAPWCLVTWQANLAAMGYTKTGPALTLTQTGTSSNKINYWCPVQSGG